MIELNMEFVAQLRECRARKHITLLEASHEIGISARQLGRIENEEVLRVQKAIFTKLVNWLVDARKPK